MRTWLAAAAILGIVSGTLAASDVQERKLRQAIAESHRGMSALAKGNTKKAQESFDRALLAIPDFPDGHLGLGHLAMREKRFDQALREFQDAAAGYRKLSAMTLQLESDRFARSRDELQELRAQLAQLASQAMRGQTGLSEANGGAAMDGQLQRQRVQLQSRIQALEEMSPPTSASAREAPAEVLFFQGNALFNLKRTQEAIAAWELALKRNPKLPLVENNLAVAYWMTGRLDDAREAMGRAEALGFKVNPNFRADLERAIASNR